jgi:hypothetical protein
MQSNHNNTRRTKHDSISSKLIAKQYGVTLYKVTPGGGDTQISTKNDPNIGIMSITSQFGPFYNAK